MPIISVVVPIYNVENFIERCLHSLFRQTLKNIEYIFINDVSTDKSIFILNEIINLYPNRQTHVKIIHHDKNLGIAKARINGMKEAKGEYVIHCDPDDYVEYDMYEKLYHRAKKYDADIVMCYHFLNEKPVEYKYYKTPQKCLKNLFKKNSHYVHLWSKLVKNEFVKKYNIFPDCNLNFEEDLNYTIKLLHYANKISILPQPLYHYCLRSNSLSTSLYKKFDPVKLKSLEANLSFLRQICNGNYKKLENYLIYKFKFNYPEIFKNEEDWFNWHKECHSHILNFDEESCKTRFILFVAMKRYNFFKVLKKFIPTLNHIYY